MTDKLCGFAVTLEEDLRTEEAESTVAAIRQIKGVISVEPVVSGLETHMGQERARVGLISDVIDLLTKKNKKS